MNKLEKRAFICILFVIVLIAGMGFFIFKLIENGAAWASYPANDHLYEDGKLTRGVIYDRNGKLLLRNTESGIPEYSGDSAIRKANLHVTGDVDNNIGSGANMSFSGLLAGYDFFNGIYSATGKSEEIYLTVDAYANLAAYDAMAGRDGTVLVYNYETGEILVSVSLPTFDPLIPGRVEEGAYINKGLMATVVPGSIFKVITATAAIESVEDISEFQHTCTGVVNYEGNDKVTCPYVHGTVNLEQALAVSCNGAFAKLSEMVGDKTLEKYTKKAGLTKSYDIDGIRTEKGTFEFPEDGLNLAWSGIGQYHDLLNPLSMMVYMGAIANGGECAVPRILIGKNLDENIKVSTSTVSLVEKDTANQLNDMLANNVVNYGEWQFPGLTVYGKTGTAEVETGENPNAWFTGYIKEENHPYAFIVLVEKGGAGGSVATDVANQVLQSLVN